MQERRRRNQLVLFLVRDRREVLPCETLGAHPLMTWLTIGLTIHFSVGIQYGFTKSNIRFEKSDKNEKRRWGEEYYQLAHLK